MKFTCESCSAQYMISDEKVGPNGVKVRCKKCGNVIVVRRAVEAVAAVAAPKPGANGAEKGLDVELGQAFDHAFGDTPPSTAAPSGPSPAPTAPAAGGDLASTQLMGSEDAAKVFASSAAPPAATEWYVAIGQAQVGPLPLAEVKKKWELGDVGPDSLVWRPGMADWTALTSVPDLAGYLAPIPRAAAQGSRAHSPAPDATGAEGPPAPAAEVSWKPVGASALAALASAEIASRSAPEPRPAAAARPSPTGVKSLVDALPDGGGVDPTGALPLNIKALETTTGEKKIERRSSVAKGAQQVRQRRSTARALAVGLVLGVVLVAGAAVGGFLLLRKIPAGRALVATTPVAPAPAPVAAPQPPIAAPPPLAPPAPAPEAKAAVAAASAAPPAPATEAHAAPPDKVERADRPGRRTKVARAEPPPPPPPRKDSRREAHDTRVAQQPPPAPDPSPKKKKGDLLDFESNDSALNEALGGGSAPTGRSVYVPPRPVGGGALPEKVSPGDINAAVAQRIESLRRCVSEQKTREPDTTGTLKMRWVIQGDGNVRDVKCLTSEYATSPFATCIAGVVKSIKFPRSATTGQEVTFPFNF